MKKVMLCILAFATVFTTALRAQDLSGNWQGTLKAGGKDIRLIVNIYKGDKDGWSGKLYSIDQTPQPFNTSMIKVDASTIKFSVDTIGGGYEGKLGADAKTMAGTWTQGGAAMPLILVRSTPETAWDIPRPPVPEKPMAADADPAFDVATIKPNPSGGSSLQGLTMNGRNFKVRNGSLTDLITVAYNVQVKQVAGAPGWADNDRYDIDGVPDQPGQPSITQLRTMIRKLLEDRCKLTIHHEKRDMSAYVLSGAKTKLTPSQTINGQLPGMFASSGKGGLTLHLINGTMTDFTGFLQMLVLDKPVVDRTGLEGRYDENITFTPDQTQFHGNPPKLPQTDVAEAPDLFAAIQQQLGLKLSAEKTAVDVIAIDHVDKPSPN
ncbi:MAG TPA: TIGR03435 family protein [Acidobacteriaceae bacterium]